MFSTSVRGSAGNAAYAAIVHTTPTGSERAASLYSPPDVYTGDANTVLEVDADDFASVRLYNAGRVDFTSEHRYCTFSGFFLF